MTANELKQRYIYAATKNLPHKSRKDVAMELDSLISDMAEARAHDGEIDYKTMRMLLEELGKPAELAKKYYAGETALISEPYYSAYRFVLKIVLLCVGFGLIAAMLISGILGGQNAGQIVWSILSSEATGLLMCFAAVTLVFVILQRLKIQFDFSQSIDSLPPVPQGNTPEIARWESIAGIVFPIVFAIVFLVLSQSLAIALTDGGAPQLIFNSAALLGAWPLIVEFALLSVIRESFKLAVGRYTMRVLIVVVITNVLSAVLAVAWLANIQIFSTEFITAMGALAGGSVGFIFQNFTTIFMVILLAALIGDTVQALIKTFKCKL